MRHLFEHAQNAVILAVAIVVLLLGGYLVRQSAVNAFHFSRQIQQLRVLTLGALRYQLDEETGVRGYAATGQPVFLQPYAIARRQLPSILSRLETNGRFVGKGLRPYVTDAARVNRLWLESVAVPLTAQHPHGPLTLEQRGKNLIDRFRDDVYRIDAQLEALERTATLNASIVIDRITAGIVAALVLVALMGAWFSVQQSRLRARTERERERAEQSRQSAERLRAAYVAEKRVAETLQNAFAQRPLPALPSLRFNATYVPAGEESKIGGDWYDAVELSKHEALFVIGDVAGHGIGAAVTMSRSRQSFISAALIDRDPASILEKVNAELLAQNAPMVTAIAGYADGAALEFRYAGAGHPPPLLIEPGRAPHLLEPGELPLGVAAEASYRTRNVKTVPGALVVLYTDGVLEYGKDVLSGEDGLLKAAGRLAENPRANPARAIYDRIFNGRACGDDVAILTIGFAGSCEEHKLRQC